MRLKIKFEYQCELQIKEKEVENIKRKLIPEEFIERITNEVNDLFLMEDGRTEAGGVTDFEYEVVE